MRIVYFAHSLRSCWNHGNAHFLRGVLRELVAAGHDVTAFEPADGWSVRNLSADQGADAVAGFFTRFPELSVETYDHGSDLSALVDGADTVIVHEWNDPWVIADLGRMRRNGSRFVLLFHDTHHRSVSDPEGIRSFDLDGYDGLLVFGETLAEVYRRHGWGRNVHVWHEAADTRLFRPPTQNTNRTGLVWVGNWGDGERSTELQTFLLQPAHELQIPLDIHGVRYPPDALDNLARYGARYHGWIANADVPDCFSRYLATVHVPRQFYARQLPGIPTIRVFEALACGIPLVSAPWQDTENLFRPGTDFLMARSGEEMRGHMRALMHDASLRNALVSNGLETIRTRHTCAHRAEQLLGIMRNIKDPVLVS